MVRKIVQYPNPILIEPSKPVVDFNEDVSQLIEDMIETCKMTENCVGLAGVQVGVPLRISVIKVGKKYIHIINPEIVYWSENRTVEWEGCMSVGQGDDQLFSKVARDSRITVKYFDKNQNPITRQCTGFLAHAFQHEIDHMNGILFLKYVSDPAKLWKDKDLNEYIKQYNKLPS